MDKSYFEDIYTTYFKVLYLFSLRIVKSSLAAEDIVQDVFTECWTNRNKIDISQPIKPYLYKLTYNRSLDFLKLSENKNLPIPEKVSVLDQILYSTFACDEQFDAKEIGKEIVTCVEKLPEKCREVFLCMLGMYIHL